VCVLCESSVCFVFFCCQHQCKLLPGKPCPESNPWYFEWDVKLLARSVFELYEVSTLVVVTLWIEMFFANFELCCHVSGMLIILRYKGIMFCFDDISLSINSCDSCSVQQKWGMFFCR